MHLAVSTQDNLNKKKHRRVVQLELVEYNLIVKDKLYLAVYFKLYIFSTFMTLAPSQANRGLSDPVKLDVIPCYKHQMAQTTWYK